MQTNPPTSDLFLSRNKNGNLKLENRAQIPMYLVTDTVHVPFGIRYGPKAAGVWSSIFITLAHGKDGSKFQDYLHELDNWLTDKITKYNEKFGTSLNYIPTLRAPMKHNEDGVLVLNDEALEKYGYTTDVRVNTKNDRVSVSLENGDHRINPVSELDFEGYVHPGSQIKCVLRQSLWQRENGDISLVLNVCRLKIFQSNYEQIDLSRDQTVRDEYEALEL